MQTLKLALAASLVLATGLVAATDASAKSGGRQGPNGHGYSYTATRSGNTVTGSVQTNAGYGATATHTGGTNAAGGKTGTTTVTTNNGATVTTHAGYADGLAGGVVTATGPDGATVQGGGAVYIPH